MLEIVSLYSQIPLGYHCWMLSWESVKKNILCRIFVSFQNLYFKLSVRHEIIGNREKEAISVMSKYPQNGSSVCCCLDYCIDARLQNCVVGCVLLVIGYVISDECHTEQEYLQYGGHGVKGWRPLWSEVSKCPWWTLLDIGERSELRLISPPTAWFGQSLVLVTHICLVILAWTQYLKCDLIKKDPIGSDSKTKLFIPVNIKVCMNIRGDNIATINLSKFTWEFRLTRWVVAISLWYNLSFLMKALGEICSPDLRSCVYLRVKKADFLSW